MKRKELGALAAGMALGTLLTGGAAAAGIAARPAWSPIYVDGRQVRMEAYNINGNNYVKLRDIGKEVGFNVYWEDGVQVDSGSPYTGEAPAQTAAAEVSEDRSGSVDLTANLELRQEMIRLINQVRRENGVPELTVNEALMNAAQDCSAQGFTSHHPQYECETAAGYGYPHGFGDNLTAFSGSPLSDAPRRAVQNWKDSPGHFQAMIDPHCDTVGTGITQSGGWTFCYMFAGDPNSHNPYE